MGIESLDPAETIRGVISVRLDQLSQGYDDDLASRTLNADRSISAQQEISPDKTVGIGKPPGSARVRLPGGFETRMKTFVTRAER